MATVAITATELTVMTGHDVTAGEGTAIVAANTNTVAYPEDGKLALLVDSNHADTQLNFINGFGINAGQAVEEVAVGDAKCHLIPVGNSAKLKDADGNISWTYEANSAGFVQAVLLP